jgi:hypothetical protein
MQTPSTQPPSTQPFLTQPPSTPGLAAYAPRGTLATQALIIALELGILADSVMRVGGFGLNITLWLLVALGCAVALTVANGTRIDRRRALLIAAITFFALVPAWRDTEELVVFSGGAVFVLLVLLAWTSMSPSMRLSRTPIGTYFHALLTAVPYGIRGPLPLFAAESRARADLQARYRRPATGILRGSIISLPILLIFGSLLVEADVAFKAFVDGALHWNTDVVMQHVLLTGFFTWISAAYLCGATTTWKEPSVSGSWLRLGVIEAGTILSLVNLLFLSFILVQLRYLFGGAEHVLATAGLSYAEYARNGFFELVVVAMLALPLLVVVTSVTRTETAGEVRAQRALATTLIVLLLLLVASALGRMRLYEQMYGWSMDRVLATAFITWIAGTIVWFGATTLRGNANRFPFGALVGGLGVIAGLVALNPASAIVENHARRLATGRKFDAAYAANLRADAIPKLVASLPDMAPGLDASAQCSIARAFEKADQYGQTQRWSSWNWGRSKAVRAVRENAGIISQALGPAPCDRAEAERKLAAERALVGTAAAREVPPAVAPPIGELPVVPSPAVPPPA